MFNLNITLDQNLVGPASWRTKPKRGTPEDEPAVVHSTIIRGNRDVQITFPRIRSQCDVREICVSNVRVSDVYPDFHEERLEIRRTLIDDFDIFYKREFLRRLNDQIGGSLNSVAPRCDNYGRHGVRFQLPGIPDNTATFVRALANATETLLFERHDADVRIRRLIVYVTAFFDVTIKCNEISLDSSFEITFADTWTAHPLELPRTLNPFDVTSLRPPIGELLSAAQDARTLAADGLIDGLIARVIQFIEAAAKWIPVDLILRGVGQILRAAGIPSMAVDPLIDGLREIVDPTRIIDALVGLLQTVLNAIRGRDWRDDFLRVLERLGLGYATEGLTIAANGMFQMWRGSPEEGSQQMLDQLRDLFGDDLEELEVPLASLAFAFGLRIVGSITEWLYEDADRPNIVNDPNEPPKWWAAIMLAGVLSMMLGTIVTGPRRRNELDDITRPQFRRLRRIRTQAAREIGGDDAQSITAGRRKNVAFLTGVVDNRQINWKAVSGRHDLQGWAPVPGPRKRRLHTYPDRRYKDTEAKLLEELLDETSETSTFNVTLVTDLRPCPSCRAVINAFRIRRPYGRLTVRWLRDNVRQPFRYTGTR